MAVAAVPSVLRAALIATGAARLLAQRRVRVAHGRGGPPSTSPCAGWPS
ncbi:hypothetical protein [Streptomyces sp. NPDC056883]